MKPSASPAAAPSGAASALPLPHLVLLSLLAVAAPTLLAYNVSPSATFLNQALSLFGFGVLGIWLALADTGRAITVGSRIVPGSRALLLAWACLAGAAAYSTFARGLPHSLALSACGLLAVAAWVWWSAQHAASRWDQPADLFQALCWALLAAGICSLAIGLIQALKPDWAVGGVIASPTVPGKAIGNLRQPNHLGTLLIWSMVATTWLAGKRRWPVALAALLLAAMVYGIVLTASRTAAIGTVLLLAWGVLDNRLSRGLRWTLVAMPFVYLAMWFGMSALSQLEGVTFAGEARLHSGSDISSSRLPVWRDTLVLIRMHPLAGVGWGNFNFAWSLTPFPQRSIHFFDHTHNILIQFAVELGLPLTLLVCGLIAYAIWGLVRQGLLEDDGTPRAAIGASAARATLVLVLMAGWHSLLEYPLWYAYFLLPMVYAWGLAMAPAGGRRVAGAADGSTPWHARAVRNVLAAGAVVVCLGTVWMVRDYWAISEIFAPSADAGPLEQRIARGQRSPLFDYQADYAEATTREEDEAAAPLATFRRPLRHLIDTRLMIAYANALHENGDDLRALFVVERLREFNRFRNEPFLDACNPAPARGKDLPWQCQPVPAQVLDMNYENFIERPGSRQANQEGSR
ncbi:MAG: polymerase [Aquabacterium sp.]|nr:MAG: polymerase [Aquabacterium sp.]